MKVARRWRRFFYSSEEERRHLRPPPLAEFVAFLLAALVALAIYVGLQAWAFTNLRTAYESANVLEERIARDPLFKSVEAQGDSDRALRFNVMLDQLRLLVDEPERATDDRAPDQRDPFYLLWRVMTSDNEQLAKLKGMFFGVEFAPSLTQAVALACGLSLTCTCDAPGTSAGAAAASEEVAGGHVAALAAALANLPEGPFGQGFASTYVEGSPELTCQDIGAPSWYAAWDYLAFAPARREGDPNLVRALLTYYQAIPLNSQWSDPEPDKEQIRRYVAFILALVAGTHSTSGVRDARYWLQLVRGIEQYLILVTACFLTVALAWRSWQLRRQEEALTLVAEFSNHLQRVDRRAERRRQQSPSPSSDDSRQLARSASLEEAFLARLKPEGEQSWRGLWWTLPAYCFRVVSDRAALPADRTQDLVELFDNESAGLFESRGRLRTALGILPALGFLGTVHGIMLALSDIDRIAGSSGVELSSAVTDVGGSLGLAFATTVFALTLGILFKLWSDRQAEREASLAIRLKQELLPLLDPSLW
jgi:hypothetical protein